MIASLWSIHWYEAAFGGALLPAVAVMAVLLDPTTRDRRVRARRQRRADRQLVRRNRAW